MPSQNHKRYEKIKHLGEGQFAHVYQARDTITGEIVAIKKIKLTSHKEDGINRSAIREIKLLHEIEHDNIVWLRDVIGNRKNIQLVMDFMETDLEVLIRNHDYLKVHYFCSFLADFCHFQLFSLFFALFVRSSFCRPEARIGVGDIKVAILNNNG